MEVPNFGKCEILEYEVIDIQVWNRILNKIALWQHIRSLEQWH